MANKEQQEFEKQMARVNKLLKSVDENLMVSRSKIQNDYGTDISKQTEALQQIETPEMAIRYADTFDERTGAFYNKEEHANVHQLGTQEFEAKKGRQVHQQPGRKAGAKDLKPRRNPHNAPQEIQNKYEAIKKFITEDYKIHLDDVAEASRMLDGIRAELVQKYGLTGFYEAMARLPEESIPDTKMESWLDSDDYLKQVDALMKKMRNFFFDIYADLEGRQLDKATQIEYDNLTNPDTFENVK